MDKEMIKKDNESASELEKLGHSLQGQSGGMVWIKHSNGKLISGKDYTDILNKVKNGVDNSPRF